MPLNITSWDIKVAFTASQLLSPFLEVHGAGRSKSEFRGGKSQQFTAKQSPGKTQVLKIPLLAILLASKFVSLLGCLPKAFAPLLTALNKPFQGRNLRRASWCFLSYSIWKPLRRKTAFKQGPGLSCIPAVLSRSSFCSSLDFRFPLRKRKV